MTKTKVAQALAKALGVVNQKGGVGKTIVSYNMVHAVAEAGHRICGVDFDVQGNATRSMGAAVLPDIDSSVFFGDSPLQLPADLPNLSFIGADELALQAVEDSALDDEQLVARLKDRLGELRARFDYLVFDTPGANNRIANAVLANSDFVILPCKVDSYSIDVATKVIRRILAIQQHWNPELVNLGILANEYDPHHPNQKEDLKALQAEYSDFMFPGWITYRSAYREAAGANVPVWRYKSRGKPDARAAIKTAVRAAGKEFRALAQKIVERMEEAA
jgi:chromosome partitioning protein